MRKKLFFLLAGFLLFTGSLSAQIVYTDGFESYTAGSGIATQNSAWTTWSGSLGSEDAQITSIRAQEGAQSLVVQGTNDVVYRLNNLSEGYYAVEFHIYVPAGRLGFFNLLQLFSGNNSKWGIQVYLFDGIIKVDGAGFVAATGSYSVDSWVKIELLVDLDNDWIEFFAGGQLVHSFQWSRGTNDDGTGVNKLDAVNFYAWAGSTENVYPDPGTPEYYIDNLSIVRYQQAPSNFDYSIENRNSVILSWNSPIGFTPINYTIERDGNEIATVPDLSYTDTELDSGTYVYKLKANYDNNLSVFAEEELTVVIEAPNSISSLEEEEVFVHPNPAKETVTINSTEPLVSVEIYNLSGQLLERKQEYGTSAKINLSNYSSGIYFLRVITTGNSHTHKLIIQ